MDQFQACTYRFFQKKTKQKKFKVIVPSQQQSVYSWRKWQVVKPKKMKQFFSRLHWFNLTTKCERNLQVFLLFCCYRHLISQERVSTMQNTNQQCYKKPVSGFLCPGVLLLSWLSRVQFCVNSVKGLQLPRTETKKEHKLQHKNLPAGSYKRKDF